MGGSLKFKEHRIKFSLVHCLEVLLMLAGVLVLVSISANVFADELPTLFRSARIQGMGGAYVATAMGEEALFLNPAALAEEKHSEMNLLVSDSTVSYDAIGVFTNGIKATSKLSSATLNQFLGQNISYREQIRTDYIAPNFGFGFLMDGQFAFEGKDKSLPKIIIGDQVTNGVVLGGGFSLGKGRGSRQNTEYRFGATVKFLFRRGGYRDLPLITMAKMSQSELSQVVGNPGAGVGFDLGSQAIFRLRNGMKIQAGASVLDVTDTSFGTDPDLLKQNLAIGVAGIYETPRMKYTLAYDYQHITETADWRKKTHLGFEAALPVLSFNLGLNQFHMAYGAGVNLWLLRFDVSSYAETIDVLNTQTVERRWDLKMALRFVF